MKVQKSYLSSFLPEYMKPEGNSDLGESPRHQIKQSQRQNEIKLSESNERLPKPTMAYQESASAANTGGKQLLGNEDKEVIYTGVVTNKLECPWRTKLALKEPVMLL